MGHEEAKAEFLRAEGLTREGRFEEALLILEALEQALPGSRRVLYQKATCLTGLGRYEEALACCAKLEGKLGAEEIGALRAKIAAEHQGRESAAPSPASHPPPEGTEDRPGTFTAVPVEEKGPPPMPRSAGADSVFQVESVFPLSTEETTVTGRVLSGAFHTGNTVSVLSPGQPPLLAPITRIGSAETPIRVMRQDQQGIIVLRVEPHYVAPGARLVADASDDAYAETMVVPDEGEDTAGPGLAMQVGVMNPALREAEQLVNERRFEPAKEMLEVYVARNPHDGGAYHLLGRVHLEADDELQDAAVALEHVQKAYELGGDRDPAVLETLAKALGMTGRPEHGLRYLERLYALATTEDAKEAWAQRIESYRKRFRLGTVWEFINSWGDVILESGDGEEIAKAIANGSVPKDAQVRRNKTGQLRSIEEALVPVFPQVATFYVKPRKPSVGALAAGGLLGLGVGVLVGAFIPNVKGNVLAIIEVAVASALLGSGIGGVLSKGKKN